MVEQVVTEVETVDEVEVEVEVLCGFQLTILPLKVQSQLHEVMVQQGIIQEVVVELQTELQVVL